MRGAKTVPELSSQYSIHPEPDQQLEASTARRCQWYFLSPAQSKSRPSKDHQAQVAELYRQIGQLKVERDFLASRSAQAGIGSRQALVVRDHLQLSIARQCQLLGVSRSGFYYQPQGPSDEELTLMKLLDQQYLKTPFYGSRKMVQFLQEQGYQVGRKRVRRLMRQLGLRRSTPNPSSLNAILHTKSIPTFCAA